MAYEHNMPMRLWQLVRHMILFLLSVDLYHSLRVVSIDVDASGRRIGFVMLGVKFELFGLACSHDAIFVVLRNRHGCIVGFEIGRRVGQCDVRVRLLRCRGCSMEVAVMIGMMLLSLI